MSALELQKRRVLAPLMRAAILTAPLMITLADNASAQPGLPLPPLPAGSPQAAGQHIYATRCASCHGTTANGGEFAPSIVARVPLRSDDELEAILHDGLASGMPAFPDIVDPDRSNLIGFLRTLKPDRGVAAARVSVGLEDGRIVRGVALNRAPGEMQVLGDDHRLYLLREGTLGRFHIVGSQTDWPNYDGPNGAVSTGGSRYSTLDQITAANVASLRPQWIYSLRDTRDIQSTPIVANGLMYVTSANECYALDAGSGRLVWHYQRPRTKGIGGVSATGINRGAAVAGDRVFMDMDNGHLIATPPPARFCGIRRWSTGTKITTPLRRPCWSATQYSPASPAAMTARAGSSRHSTRLPGRSYGDSGRYPGLGRKALRPGKVRASTIPAARPG
jgi:alcohol dehydrogenase (cytochrome c)